jgi:hypothetical protein
MQNGAGLYKYCGARRCGGNPKCYKMERVLVLGTGSLLMRWKKRCKTIV